jgi:hypothetical protein
MPFLSRAVGYYSVRRPGRVIPCEDETSIMTAWINLVIRYRYGVMGIVLLVTLGLMSQIGHLEVILSSDNRAPQSNHYIKTGIGF